MYSKNFTKFGLDMNLFVSIVSAIFVLVFSLFTIIWPGYFFGSRSEANHGENRARRGISLKYNIIREEELL